MTKKREVYCLDLCKSCHTKTNYKREYWRGICSKHS